jgi:BirA family transcriptional regulator, biotin operon repressor / biotin---[acetyl-CoA-carboxylase] ligase
VSDLSLEALVHELPGRPVRSYPALLSTHADALAWARAGAPEGALVVADYQASPRGRGGLEWRVVPGEGLGFSLVLRPELPAEREGWLYAVALCALADVVGDEAAIEWPDEVRAGGAPAATVGLHVELGADACEWAVLTALLPAARPPRAPLLASAAAAIDARYRSAPTSVLADYLRRCATLDRRVHARLVPLGPAGASVTGRALTVRPNGALVLETDEGDRIAIPPQSLGLLEPA